MWRAPRDPQIFGALDVEAGPLLAFIDKARARGVRVTPTHLAGRALAHALEAVPELNVQIRGGRARPRPTIDIFFIAAIESGHDLSGIKIVDAAHKPVTAIAAELDRRALHLRRGRDPDFARTKRLTDRMPMWLLRRMLAASAFLTEDLRLEVPALGLHRTPFGSAMVSSVGSLGLPHGFAPLAWMYDVPILVLVGELVDRPVVVDGRVVVRTMLPITATIDHRYVDGAQVARAMRAFRAYLAAPEAIEHREDRAA